MLISVNGAMLKSVDISIKSFDMACLGEYNSKAIAQVEI